ncbi:hypothetical protein CONPUDRAFT_162869 [Coniophora puteana RWD-64-598 SS2]|uniref:F-box domain-containing protein n=1 Tax=Coniophora puteana (strain RWD-64-598) TaxID=741705 RepID=A0A5M3N4I2_CONPW|nr:uncharacterized protein CONPUDRAFT_162869 [Coniophora puteana RWD-64-598 SS2]EIW85745.1 hypothetical protein CONPUDRAFT_162869 [Coniophora puteana RWD-64-598 SS2]
MTARRHSIQSLAPETLLEIFDHLSTSRKRSKKTGVYSPIALYPFTIASVCRHWLDVASLKSKYWSDVVIPLDFPILPSIMGTYLDAFNCQDTPHFHIVYFNTVPIQAQVEKARLDDVMRLLVPYFHKCKTISIYTCYRSSTILVTKYLTKRSLIFLEDLSLVSSITDTTQPACFASMTCPKLKSLSVDAKTFTNLIEALEIKSDPERDMDHVRITSYHPTNCRSDLEPDDLVCGIAELADGYGMIYALDVSDVIFDPSLTWLFTHISNVYEVRLVDLQKQFLAQLLGSFRTPQALHDYTSVSLTRCILPYPAIIGDMFKLSFIEMGDSNSILNALKRWEGVEIEVKNCSGFTDIILDTVSSERLCPNATSLKIHKCPISVKALRRFVRSKQNVNPLTKLCVSKGPSLFWWDKVWLEGKVEDASWNGKKLHEVKFSGQITV